MQVPQQQQQIKEPHRGHHHQYHHVVILTPAQHEISVRGNDQWPPYSTLRCTTLQQQSNGEPRAASRCFLYKGMTLLDSWFRLRSQRAPKADTPWLLFATSTASCANGQAAKERQTIQSTGDGPARSFSKQHSQETPRKALNLNPHHVRRIHSDEELNKTNYFTDNHSLHTARASASVAASLAEYAMHVARHYQRSWQDKQ